LGGEGRGGEGGGGGSGVVAGVGWVLYSVPSVAGLMRSFVTICLSGLTKGVSRALAACCTICAVVLIEHAFLFPT
jgi:hypothetical protein